MNKKIYKLLFLLLFVAIILVVFNSGFRQNLSFEYLNENKEDILKFYRNHQLQTVALFMAAYILVTTFSIPGATILTLAGGAIFGFRLGLFIVSFASTIGASLAFLSARYLFRDYLQNKFEGKLRIFNQGIERDGATFLLTLRLIPIFPFFLINLLMGLTKIKTKTFFIISQLGMLLGTAVYINAGSELSKINSLNEILTPTLLISFTLLGLLPFLGKLLVKKIKRLKT